MSSMPRVLITRFRESSRGLRTLVDDQDLDAVAGKGDARHEPCRPGTDNKYRHVLDI